MKKYLFGLSAIAIAVTLASFTAPAKPSPKKFTTYFFQFVGTPGTESNSSNWQYATTQDLTTGCNAGTDASCKIELSEDKVTVPGSGNPFITSSTVPVKAGSGSNQIPDNAGGFYTNIQDRED